MKSIRLSLLIYFLLLQAVALGAVMLVVHQTGQDNIREKEQSTRSLLQSQHAASRNQEHAKLDEDLLRHAQRLANLVHTPYEERSRLYPIGLLNSLLLRGSDPLMPLWYAEMGDTELTKLIRGRRPTRIVPDREWAHSIATVSLLFAGCPEQGRQWMVLPCYFTERAQRSITNPLYRTTPSRIQFAERVIPGNTEGQEGVYCQICGEIGEGWQWSHSMGDQSFDLPVRARGLMPSEWMFDTTQLEGSGPLRRITYKAPVPRVFFFWKRPFPEEFARPWDGRRGGPPPGSAPADRGQPVFYIQCAVSTQRRDSALARLEEDLQQNLATQEQESRLGLVALRSRLLWISLLAFAATAVGGFVLVHLGLSPLRRLSEAVRRVSPRDFSLPVDANRLPRELRPIAQRLSETLDMLKRAFSREKQAAADISHELRTPLAALLTTLDLALRKPRSPEEYREFLEDCRASGQQMSQLVERLLTLARLDAGVDALRPREVDVAALAEQCAAVVRPLAEARALSLHVHHQGPAPLTADPDKLREVLTNLLHNAIEYNRPSGSVDLRVERENGHLRVEVSDTGIGIASQDREKIFERFYRADPSRQAEGLHAGLGLSIVKGYVDLMGGSIAVESVEGQGSTFRVQLPVR